MKFLLCAGALLGFTSVANADPAWCSNFKDMEQGFQEDLAKPDVEQQLLAAAYLKCNPRQAASLPKVDAAIQSINKTLNITDADWGDVADYARSHGEKGVPVTNDKAPWSTRDPLEQYATFQHPSLSVPGYSGDMDLWYLADLLGPSLSQAARLQLVEYCVRETAEPTEWAICQADIDALDFAKLDAEVRADKTHTGAARIAVRLDAYHFRPELKKHADAVAKLKARDATWTKLFELAAQEKKAWDTRYRDKAELVAVAAAMDDAIVTGSRKASAGCQTKTWDQLAIAVRALPAKAFASHRKKDEEEVIYGDDVIETVLTTVIGDPDAFLAANAYMLCYIAEQAKDILAINLQPRISRWAGFRGPRTGAVTRMILAALEFDDRSTKLRYPDLHRFWIHDNREGGQIIGIVASVKPKGDKVTVAYAKKLVKAVYDTGCTQGRLHGIRGDGSFEYELNCTGSVTEMVDRRPPPEDIEARYAKELKPGMQSLIRQQALFLAWPKEGATLPVLVLGQPVK